jgi:hypothetical protein
VIILFTQISGVAQGGGAATKFGGGQQRWPWAERSMRLGYPVAPIGSLRVRRDLDDSRITIDFKTETWVNANLTVLHQVRPAS